MRTFSLCILSCALMAEPAIPKDKQMHIVAGAAISLTSSFVAKKMHLKNPEVVGFAMGVLAGVVKEKYDRRHPKNHTYDVHDAYCTAIGATVSFTVRW